MRPGKRILPWLALSAVLLAACDEDRVTMSLPEVLILSPQNGQVVSGLVSFAVEVESAVAVTEVRFAVDDEVIDTDTEAPWEIQWDSGAWADGGSHRLQAAAVDFNGDLGLSEYVVVVVAAP